jgi:diphosphomevalonate decarboxylase
MSECRILARAPSNIAIVKYMGKADAAKNLPVNPSLSLTLSQLCTFVEIRGSGSGSDEVRFVGEKPEGAKGEVPVLTLEGKEKFLRHFERCRTHAPRILGDAGLETRAVAGADILSSNTFPTAAGIASSASSFAALTLASIAYFSKSTEKFLDLYREGPALKRELAALSREGSGSSCRSFEGPFVAWESDRAARVESTLAPLSDLVVVVAAGAKKVGSSEAHRRVLTSPHWSARADHAGRRFSDLKKAILSGDFPEFSKIANADSKEMHQLFETSVPPFSYFAAGTSEVLDFLASESGIAVTMDAGPNVHVIVPQAHEEFWRRKLVERFPQFPLLIDREGSGAELTILGPML